MKSLERWGNIFLFLGQLLKTLRNFRTKHFLTFSVQVTNDGKEDYLLIDGQKLASKADKDGGIDYGEVWYLNG